MAAVGAAEALHFFFVLSEGRVFFLREVERDKKIGEKKEEVEKRERERHFLTLFDPASAALWLPHFTIASHLRRQRDLFLSLGGKREENAEKSRRPRNGTKDKTRACEVKKKKLEAAKEPSLVEFNSTVAPGRN